MRHEEGIQKAIKCAKGSEARGGVAIGAIVVNAKGQIVGTGMSLAGVLHDVTQHGETMAIRDACEKMRTINLEGCTLYGTLEPCSMCLSAALWANMDAAYFGAYAADAPKNQYVFKNYIAEEWAPNSQRWNGKPIKVEGGILRAECKDLLNGYENWQKAAT